jgi:Rrf2 family cysteine metabolism transcriptional repressor
LALEGPLLPTDSGRDNVPSTEPMDRELIREIWDDLRALLEQRLSGLTIDDLVQRKRERNGEMMYYI